MHGASCSTHCVWHVSSSASCGLWEYDVLDVQIIIIILLEGFPELTRVYLQRPAF